MIIDEIALGKSTAEPSESGSSITHYNTTLNSHLVLSKYGGEIVSFSFSRHELGCD